VIELTLAVTAPTLTRWALKPEEPLRGLPLRCSELV
jgi:hypothetical protein